MNLFTQDEFNLLLEGKLNPKKGFTEKEINVLRKTIEDIEEYYEIILRGKDHYELIRRKKN